MNKKEKLAEQLEKQKTPYDAQLKRAVKDIEEFEYFLSQAKLRKEYLENKIKEIKAK